MELRHLRYFVAVAEELHFRRAAERLHVAQPAVSEQVRKLEEELGVRLLDRTHRSVSLTDAGSVMLEEARRVLRMAEMAQVATRNARDRGTSRLRIGYVAAALPASVPRALQRLAANSPRLEAMLEEGSSFDLVDDVLAERLDAAVITLPAPVRNLRVTSLGWQHGVAALPVGHEQAVRPSIDLERMAPARLVVLPREADRPFHDAVVASCRQAGLSPTIVELPDAHVEQALLAVASGAGIADPAGVGGGALHRSRSPLRSARGRPAQRRDGPRHPPRRRPPAHRGVAARPLPHRSQPGAAARPGGVSSARAARPDLGFSLPLGAFWAAMIARVATILVVDDDPAFLALAARVLEGMGAKVIATAEDTEGALSAADATHPDAALVDVGLEDGGGIELAYTLAARTRPQRVVLISSDTDAGRAVAGAADGRPVVPFVPKEELASEVLRGLLLGP